jgi:hypothetical protein
VTFISTSSVPISNIEVKNGEAKILSLARRTKEIMVRPISLAQSHVISGKYRVPFLETTETFILTVFVVELYCKRNTSSISDLLM